jgi:DNA repair exonuclease SbcCD ATPase subunit
MAKNNAPEGDIISVPMDAPQVEQFVEDAMAKTNSKLFSQDEVENIRKQEKDKMYKRLEEADLRVKAMEEQMNIISSEREAARKEAEERAAKEAEILRQRELDELSAKELLLKKEDEFNQRINTVEQEWQGRLAEIESQRQAQEALLEKERQMQELVHYRNQRLQQEQESIIPELIDLVSGNSPEEIENSISILRERSSAIIESIQQATQQSQGRLRGAPVTAPPVGPMETQTEYQQLSADDIRNMSMEKYAQMRERLLNARSSRGRF